MYGSNGVVTFPPSEAHYSLSLPLGTPFDITQLCIKTSASTVQFILSYEDSSFMKQVRTLHYQLSFDI